MRGLNGSSSRKWNQAPQCDVPSTSSDISIQEEEFGRVCEEILRRQTHRPTTRSSVRIAQKNSTVEVPVLDDPRATTTRTHTFLLNPTFRNKQNFNKFLMKELPDLEKSPEYWLGVPDYNAEFNLNATDSTQEQDWGKDISIDLQEKMQAAFDIFSAKSGDKAVQTDLEKLYNTSICTDNQLTNIYNGYRFMTLKEVREDRMISTVLDQNMMEFFSSAKRNFKSVEVCHEERRGRYRERKAREYGRTCFCLRMINFFKGDYMTYLHFAAANNRHMFVHELLNNSEYWVRLVCGSEEESQKMMDHVKVMRNIWLNFVAYGLLPIDLASRLGHETLEVFLGAKNGAPRMDQPVWINIDSVLNNKYDYGFRSFDKYRLTIPDTLLCSMAFHGQLHLIPSEILGSWIEKTDKHELKQAVRDACVSGNEKSLRALIENSRYGLELLDPQFPYYPYRGRGGRTCTHHPPPMHLALLYKNTSIPTMKWADPHRHGLTITTMEFTARKNIRDDLGHSPLCYTIHLDDESILKMYTIYRRSATMTEKWVLVHTLIAQKRSLLVLHILNSLLDDDVDFDSNSSLPLTSGFIVDDMSIVESISQLYHLKRCRKNWKMMDEDLLRSVVLVQHNWEKRQAAHRLAQMMLLISCGVDVHHPRWTSSMIAGDDVSKYLMKIEKPCDRSEPPLKWRDAWEEACSLIEGHFGIAKNDIMDYD